MNTLNIEPEFEIVTDGSRFLELEREWDSLWSRTSDRRFTQSFAWRVTGWQTTGRPRGRSLCVLVMRVAGEAVLIWPMAVRRRLLFWRVAAPLGPEFTDYDPVLVAEGPAAASHTRAAWAHLRGHCPADVVTVPLVRHDAAMHEVLSTTTARQSVETLPSPYVTWDGFGSWDQYWRARSKNTKSRIGRRMRRFEELGDVTFALVDDPEEYARLLEWSLKEKVAWMARMELDNDFMATPEFHDFLSRLGGAVTPQGRWVMFALKIDGRTVATKMGTIDDRRYEGFIAAQDTEFANYSVGSIILIKTLEWLMTQGLEYDFRIGEELYKLDWATADCPASTYRLAHTAWGAVLLTLELRLAQARAAQDRLRASISPELRARVKAWILTPLSLRRRPPGFTVAVGGGSERR